MARTWILDGRGIARKVKNAAQSSSYPTKDYGPGANLECPNCKYCIDNSDVSVDWPGLPAGVKFDPSDVELIEHLAGKTGLKNSRLHPLIEEFIPTLEEDEGICYTHPENLPGVKKDGSSAHFFHRTSNAYSTGCRKRRKIQKGCSISDERVRWHKTGKTRPVMDNGAQKGCKKIMVLYKSAKKSKPDKTNWVMHQYHLGTSEDEKDGELVVSKIFYQRQPSHMERTEIEPDVEGAAVSPMSVSLAPDLSANRVSPTTPKSNTPEPPKPQMFYPYDEGDEDNLPVPLQELHDTNTGVTQPKNYSIHLNNDIIDSTWMAGEPQLTEDRADLDTSLFCDEDLDSLQLFEAYSDKRHAHYDPNSSSFNRNDILEKNSFSGFPELDNIDIGTPPDFNLSDLQFGSQESIMSWLDRL